ncbi:MAG: hypothetical protein GYB67_08060 [Chloroflexi bacterium]|nr:hypothetical protein [Chloroflexota bacterium]
MSASRALYQLQTIDLSIRKHRKRLQAIRAELGEDETVADARQRFESASADLKSWQVRARDIDLEIKRVAEKANTTDEELYAGRITNPKELQDLEQESASLKRRQAQLEENLLEAMMESETRLAEVAELQQILDDAESKWTNEQSDLVDEKKQIEAEISGLQGKREQVVAKLDSDSLTLYDQMSVAKRGRAIAVLQDGSCSVCGVEQNTVIAQQVRQDKATVYCVNCGRILVIV